MTAASFSTWSAAGATATSRRPLSQKQPLGGRRVVSEPPSRPGPSRSIVLMHRAKVGQSPQWPDDRGGIEVGASTFVATRHPGLEQTDRRRITARTAVASGQSEDLPHRRRVA
ncbi:MAG: hypothetical protein R2710_02525 [Acidimicrobiales bacterium]